MAGAATSWTADPWGPCTHIQFGCNTQRKPYPAVSAIAFESLFLVPVLQKENTLYEKKDKIWAEIIIKG